MVLDYVNDFDNKELGHLTIEILRELVEVHKEIRDELKGIKDKLSYGE